MFLCYVKRYLLKVLYGSFENKKKINDLFQSDSEFCDTQNKIHANYKGTSFAHYCRCPYFPKCLVSCFSAPGTQIQSTCIHKLLFFHEGKYITPWINKAVFPTHNAVSTMYCLTIMPLARASAPFLLMWFQLRSMCLMVIFSETAGPNNTPAASLNSLWLRFRYSILLLFYNTTRYGVSSSVNVSKN